MQRRLRVLLVEPFYSGSHATWANMLRDHSRHDLALLTLPGRHWQWRMHGGAAALSDQYRSQVAEGFESSGEPDVLLVSSMLDLPQFLALTFAQSARPPVIAYFHENQFVYPPSPRRPPEHQGRDLHYQYINFATAHVADRVCFNSDWNRSSFLDGAGELLRAMPDSVNPGWIKRLADTSCVISPGCALPPEETARPTRSQAGSTPVRILWNHRREYDKNPAEFFDVLHRLAKRGADFRLVLLGQGGQRGLDFGTFLGDLKHRVVHDGYVADRDEYWDLVAGCDVLPVTAHHEFFGMSVVEAMGMGVLPLLPQRLAYPELLASAPLRDCLYSTNEELEERLWQLCTGAPGGLDLQGRRGDLSAVAAQHRPPSVVAVYDRLLAAVQL